MMQNTLKNMKCDFIHSDPECDRDFTEPVRHCIMQLGEDPRCGS